MANWNEAIDGELQWHDLLNPVGMGAYVINTGKAMLDNISGKTAQQNQNVAFQREDTAIQRQMADMQQAGINPILMATNGWGGASSASAAQSISNTSQNTQAMTNLLSSALMLLLATKGMGTGHITIPGFGK